MNEDIIHDAVRLASNQLWWQLCLILLAVVPLFTIVAVWHRPEILKTIITRWDRRQAEKKVENCPHSWTIYVNISKCSLCKGLADTDFVLKGQQEQWPDLVITADNSECPLNPKIQQVHCGIHTANITGAKKRGF